MSIQLKGFKIVIALLGVMISSMFGGVAFAQRYTGLVVDATGLKADPVLYPEVLTVDKEGVKQPVYTGLNVDPNVCAQIGLVQYTDTLEEAKYTARVGSNPYIVRAERVVGSVVKGNFIISLEDARKIRDANKLSGFLTQCCVAIAIGEHGGAGRTIVAPKEKGGSKVYETTEMVAGIDHFDYKRNMAVAYGEGTIPQNAPDPQTGRIMAKEEARLVAEAGLIRLLKGVRISAETTSEIAEKHYLTRRITEKLEGYLKGAAMSNLKYVTDKKTGEFLYVLVEMEVPISSSINEVLVPIHKERLYRIYEYRNPNF